MRTTRVVKVDAVETVAVFCNKCGDDCCYYGMGGPQGIIELSVVGGYGSTHLGDMNHYCFSLCDRCTYELFQTFKHPAFVRDMDGLYTPPEPPPDA